MNKTITKQLDALKAKLEAVEQQHNTTEDADTAVSTAVTARHLRQQIATLEKLEAAANKQQEQPKPISDRQSLTAIIQQRQQEHADKLTAIKNQITDTAKARAEQERIFTEATARIDIDAATAAAGEIDRLNEKAGHLKKMLDAAEKLPVFSTSELSDHWGTIVDEMQPIMDGYIDAVAAAAKQYRQTVKQLARFNDMLLGVRSTLHAEADKNGCMFDMRGGTLSHRCYFQGREFDTLRVRDSDSGVLMLIGQPVRGTAL